MIYQELYHGLIAGIHNMNWAEALAVIFSIASVLFARANNIWVYPTGIAGILLSIYIFIGAKYKLYPDAALNLYYLVMSIYGWFFWLRKPPDKSTIPKNKQVKETPITWCNKKEYITAAVIFIVLWGGLFWWLDTYKINNVPLMDSFTSAIEATGMWLLAKRKVENWIALMIGDGVDIIVFFVKHLILFCVLNIFYVVIAILGYIAWKKLYQKRIKNNLHLVQEPLMKR
ncbi:MAG: nicotinamide riboside transporter PnuC [Chitinophagaceae bacterium]